jgi:hypothetical protein
MISPIVTLKAIATTYYLRFDGVPKRLIINGGRGGNRTHNPRLRRPVLYPIELLARFLSL